MKMYLGLILLAGIASARFTEDLETFNEEMGIIEDAPEKIKKMEEEVLKKTEEEINKNNEDYDNGKSSFKEQLTEFSDMIEDELKMHEGLIDSEDEGRGLGLIMPPEEERISSENLDEVYAELDRQSIPASYSAKDKGLLTSVKNQGSCGSCVAFAAHAQHETAMIKAGAKKKGLDLSEQYLIDCAYGNGANGCNGASPPAYSQWFKKNGGHSLHETKYPYLGRNPKLNCKAAKKIKKWNSGAQITKVTVDWKCNETKLKKLIATYGSVQVGLYASDSSFGSYKSGVWNGCTKGKRSNHAVVAVGYGTENGKKYWLVRNSWGTNWGLSGYFKIQRGTNHCNIESGCIWTEATKSGTPGVVPTAAPTKKPAASMWCDLSKLFGRSNMSGRFRLRIWVRGSNGRWKPKESKVKCVKSKCTPISSSGVTNACKYICGKTKC